MTAKVLGIELNLKLINLSQQEHLTPEFLKVNGDFIIYRYLFIILIFFVDHRIILACG